MLHAGEHAREIGHNDLERVDYFITGLPLGQFPQIFPDDGRLWAMNSLSGGEI